MEEIQGKKYKDLVSVIVPIYNCEDTIKRCVDSILTQSYENLEVILINDGSTDGSYCLCEELEKQDNRIRLLTKANGGVSSARNCGLEIASGKYITFVDADDWIDSRMIDVLVDTAAKDNSDIAACYFSIDSDKTSRSTPKEQMYLKHTILNQKECCRELCKDSNFKLRWENCSKLFKNDIIKRIKYDPKISMGEDWLFMMETLVYCHKISVVPYCFYHYVTRVGSATQEFNFKQLSACLADEKVLMLNLPLQKRDVFHIKSTIGKRAVLCKYKWLQQGIRDSNYYKMANQYRQKYFPFTLLDPRLNFISKIKLVFMAVVSIYI